MRINELQVKTKLTRCWIKRHLNALHKVLSIKVEIYLEKVTLRKGTDKIQVQV